MLFIDNAQRSRTDSIDTAVSITVNGISVTVCFALFGTEISDN